MENNPQPLNIPYPPDFVFKHRSRNRLVPAQQVMQEQAMFVFTGMKYPFLKVAPARYLEERGLKIENNDLVFASGARIPDALDVTDEEVEKGGQIALFKGVPYPAKGHPFPEAIHAVNFVKRLTRNSVIGFANKDLWKEAIGFILSTKKRKIGKISRFLDLYCDIGERVLLPYILEDEYLSPCAYEIMAFLRNFLCMIGIGAPLAHRFAEIFASQIEYDNAYRLRIEDAMSETTQEAMMENPIKELRKMGQLFVDRQPVKADGMVADAGQQLKRGIDAVCLILRIPKYQMIFRNCIETATFKNFQLDDADRYHILLWGDYNFLGKTLEERVKIYEGYHKDGFPPRLIFKPNQ